MKLLKNCFIYQAVVGLFITHSFLFARQETPASVLPAYNNKISHISYAIGSDDQHALTFVFQQKPICMYTPLNYQEIKDDSLNKTYFLPRTQCADAHVRYFYDDVKKALQPLGINLEINEITDKNYGVQMIFKKQPDSKYEIVKVLDFEKNLVHFNFVMKI